MSSKKENIITNIDSIIEKLNQYSEFYISERKKYSENFTMNEKDAFFYNEVLLDILNSKRLDTKFNDFNIDYLEWISNTDINTLVNNKGMTNNQSRFAKLLFEHRNILQIGSYEPIFLNIMKYFKK